MNLQKYNQTLLAILGTLAALGLLILIFIGLFDFISRQIRNSNRSVNDSGIVIDQNQVVDTATFEFIQEISILEPFQLDSAKPVFIIPIGQKDQTNKRSKMLTAGLSFGSASYSEDYYYSSFRGLYNNFVLIDYLRNIRQPIFNSKIALTEWAYMKIDTSQIILFKGTDHDLNKDGRLNDDDFQSLFVFNVSSKQITELKFNNQTVLEFDPLLKTNKIYVRTGKDTNKDNVYDTYSEPTDLYFYDVATNESETLVPEEIKMHIQEILSK